LSERSLHRDRTYITQLGIDMPKAAWPWHPPGMYRIETTMRMFVEYPLGAPDEFIYAWSFNIPSPAHAAPLAIMFMLVPRRRRC